MWNDELGYDESQLLLPFGPMEPVVIYLSERDFTAFKAAIDNPPEPNERLKNLIARKSPFLELAHNRICPNCTCGLKGGHGSQG
jgi:hypothetical protein